MAHHAVIDPRPVDYRDARMCAVLLAPDLLEAMTASADDVVRISTHRGRTALGRIAGPIVNGADGTIQIDRFTRQALKAYPHEEVHLDLVQIEPTAEVALVPGVDMSHRFNPQLVPQLKRALIQSRAPLRRGMLLYIRLPDGLAGIAYDVHFVRGNEGYVTDETALWLIQDDHDHGPGEHDHEHDRRAETVVDTTYEDIGGLNAQIREVREFVELPLIFPQVYRQLGINPPKGVIFFGAPGTGKTLLARSVANEINAKFYYINGPEVIGTFTGQTEENLRKIFGDASTEPPAIIFIDELDAIAPVRRMASTMSDARAVTQLLALLDGLKRAEGVMVIGTTNRIEAIDPALRRAGRFDREIYFPTPSSEAREQILRVHTREMPLNDNAIAALPAIAERAYGYVGADLMELSREAGLNALRRASQAFIASPSLASYPKPEDLIIESTDFEAALTRVRPASMRESLISFPSVTWRDVGGLEHVKKRLRELVEQPLRHPEQFARIGLSTNLGVLLYGPPGTGKTLLAKAIARESGVNFIPIQGPELFSQWLGESEESVRHIFNVARRAAPCIVFFDQLDAVLSKRSDGDSEGSRAPQRVVNQLLAELDGMEQLGNVIVIGATNRMAMVDPAALRPGRFGVHLHVGLPESHDRAEILRIHLHGAALDEGASVDSLVSHLVPKTEGLSGADLAFLCQAAKLDAMQEADFQGTPRLAPRHFDAILPELGSGASAQG